jgi:hypothetical protein
MADKIDANLQISERLDSVEIVLSSLQENMALLRTSMKEQKTDQSQTPETQNDLVGIKWHCVLCGHSWEGHVKTNPEPPEYCAACKKSNWHVIPKNGLQGMHKNQDGKRCKRCAEIIQTKLDALEKLKLRLGNDIEKILK